MLVVVGISFNLIIIRVDKGIALGDSLPPESLPLNFAPTPSENTSRGIEVEISRDIRNDTGDAMYAMKDICWNTV